MKTVEEVREKFKDYQGGGEGDPFGFRGEILSDFLPECYKPGYRKECPVLTKEEVLARMKEYMQFAMNKAIDHRGLSAGRSIEKFCAWLWILDDTELLEFAEDDGNYENYGMPILKRIASKYGFPIPEEAQKWEDGKPCTPDCCMGCGKSLGDD